jgi:hypothetical protein
LVGGQLDFQVGFCKIAVHFTVLKMTNDTVGFYFFIVMEIMPVNKSGVVALAAGPLGRDFPAFIQDGTSVLIQQVEFRVHEILFVGLHYAGPQEREENKG